MPHGIDHLVLAVRDLDAAAAFYRALGFTVGARNRHPWGTLNHIVQMPGQFLELIALEPGFVKPAPDQPVYNFAGFLSDYLATREGLAMLVLESRDAKADLLAFKAAGIGKPEPFFFERRGKRPDGSDVHVAFTLAFAAAPPGINAGFFVSQQHFPENFWNPAFQTHSNGVAGIDAVVLETSEPDLATGFVGAFCGQPMQEPNGRDAAANYAFDTGRGAVEIVGPAGPGNSQVDHANADARFVAVRFKCPDLNRVRKALDDSRVASHYRDGTIVIPAAAAFGVVLVFKATA